MHAALEDAFTAIVGNAAHMRNVPGRCDASPVASASAASLFCRLTKGLT